MGAAIKLNPFDIIPSDGFTTVKLNGQMDLESSKAFVEALPALISTHQNDIVINCENTSELSGSWIKALVQLNQKLKAHNKQLRLIFVTEALADNLKREGVFNALKSCANLQAALVELGHAKAKVLDVNFINPFLAATIKVLKTQCSTDTVSGRPYRKESHAKFAGDISGVIGLVSEAFSGSVVISFPEATFLKIVSRAFGEEHTEINSEIEDSAGELTNMIFGQAKATLNEKGYGIKTALPSVISGRDHSITQMTKGARIVVPFETDVGEFFIEICISG